MAETRRPTVGKVTILTGPSCCQVCGAPSAVVLSFPSSNTTVVVSLCAPCKKALKEQL